MDFKKMKELDELLLQKRILLVGEISRDEQVKFNSDLLYLNVLSSDKEISIFIDSEGGDVDTGMMIFDAIKTSKAPVNAVVCGFCKSAGFVILQACKKRIALPHAQLMFHYPRIFRMSVNLDIQREKEKLMRLHNSIFDLTISRSSQKILKAEFLKMIENDEYIPAEDALKFGLIDEIVEKIEI